MACILICKGTIQKQKIMMSISINVAFCSNCNGYCSATPAEKKHLNHPDVIDHFFYHGEPWFTLDHKTFEKKTQLEDVEVRILDFADHITQDQKYCHCVKAKKTLQTSHRSLHSKTEHNQSTFEIPEIESDLYFKDLYHTYYNFHSQHVSRKYAGNSTRTF
ncbi:hypothetical protein AR685_12565 [Chryseobacterium sp. JAH]|nr:hypothetical protein AR685_12565 [Chryseobacterium sp. JAH]